MFKPNKPTGETMSEGSPMPEEPNEMDMNETPAEEAEESPVKQYFESLDDTEKEELCQLVREYDSQNKKTGELDMEGMEDEGGE